ncbi:hypothetical protein JL721_1116 [Aureococcus anophagefferens]|nr:hypothetical protein JL721_1116 [Aureococcus anophagefferens]
MGHRLESKRPQQGVFADREVLPFSSDEEKQKWCDLHWKAHGKTGGAKQGQRWARVCPAPEGHGPKFQPWRDANRWSGCAAKQFVGRVSGPGAYVELGHNGPGSCVVGDGDPAYPVHLNLKRDARNARPHPTLVDGHVAHAFGVYPDEVAHNINQFPRLLRIARHVPANSTTLLVHDSRLWREWVAMLARRRMIPDELKIRYVPIRKTGSTIFKPRDPRDSVFFAGEAQGSKRVIQRRFNVSEAVPIFPDHVSTGWYTLGGEETCAFQLALNRTYVSRLLSACPDPEPNTREIPHLGGSVPARTAACVVEVLIVSRQDARTRSVKNHDAMVKRVLAARRRARAASRRERQRLRRQGAHARVERGGLAAGHVVIAPHGAALANVIFVQPDTLLAAAASADSQLFASMAQGSYSGPMTADLDDVARLMTDRVAPRLLDRPDLTARHLAPPPSGAACPPAPGFASLPP